MNKKEAAAFKNILNLPYQAIDKTPKGLRREMAKTLIKCLLISKFSTIDIMLIIGDLSRGEEWEKFKKEDIGGV